MHGSIMVIHHTAGRTGKYFVVVVVVVVLFVVLLLFFKMLLQYQNQCFILYCYKMDG